MRWSVGLAVAAVAALLLVPAPAEARAPRLGLNDDLAFSDYRSQPRLRSYRRARAAGARLLRLTLDWSRVAPRGTVKPQGFDASDPAAPQYNFSYIEDEVRDARARGLDVMFTVVRAPRWAEAADKPRGSRPGAWRPDPAELASFIRAAARRFSGFFADPKFQTGEPLLGAGRALPHVRYWQIWEEPNGNRKLQPTFSGRRLVAAAHYRRMLNASAAALKAVDGDNVVITAGMTARGGAGARPLAFWRSLLCLTRGGRRTCGERARFNAYAHNPRTNGSPFARLGRDQLGLRDLPRLRRVVRQAARQGTVSGGRKSLWITEIGWDTPPLARRGVSMRVQARNLVGALYLSSRARASVVVWSGLQDRPTYIAGIPSMRSGLYLPEGRRSGAKRALGAFRFPFLVRRSAGRIAAWGMAPRRGRRVAIQRRIGRGWQTLRRVRAARSREFRAVLPGRRGVYRAVQGSRKSLPWRG